MKYEEVDVDIRVKAGKVFMEIDKAIEGGQQIEFIATAIQEERNSHLRDKMGGK